MSKERQLHYHITFDAASVRTTHRSASVIAPLAGVIYRVFGQALQTGVDNLPQSPPDTDGHKSARPGVIFAAHHMSLLDPVFVGLNLWRNGFMPHFLAKSTLFKEPLATVLRWLGQIPVLRGSAHASDSLRYAREALAAGESVVIYPQGTLTKDEEFWPQAYKSGAARLALETGAPVVPVAHWGMQDIMPHGAKRPQFKPRGQLLIHYGAPITVTGIAPTQANVSALTRYIEARVAADLAQLRGVKLPERFRANLTWEKK